MTYGPRRDEPGGTRVLPGHTKMKAVWEEIRRLDERAEPHVIVTVVRRVRPSSATVGDKAIVTADGQMTGFVGGHCTQSHIVEQARECLRTGESKLLLVASEPPDDVQEGVTVLSMTCASGGMVELFLEPKYVDRTLILVGDSPVARALEEMAPRYTLVPRRIALEEESRRAGDPLERLANQLTGFGHTPSYAVVASMGLYDREGLLALMRLPLKYLGLVTSPRRWTSVRAELAEAGAPNDYIDFVTAPAGFDIGAVGGEEVALSILAQIVERRRGGTDERWEGDAGQKMPGPAEAAGPGHGDADRKNASVAFSQQVTDPVCGMTVDLEKTPFRFELEGTTYGFCCSGCQSRFVKDPEAYLSRV